MLADFFKLNGPSEAIEQVDEEELLKHFHRANHIKNTVYRPDEWPEKLRKASGIAFENVSLSKTRFTRMTFTACTFTDCLFIGCLFEEVEFHNCSFNNCNFYKSNFSRCYINPNSFQFNKAYKKTASNVVVDLFQNLMENSASMKQDEFFVLSDYRFRQWKRAQLDYDFRQNKIGRFQLKWKKFKSFVYEWIAGFGYEPMRFFLFTIVIFMLISCFNYYALRGAISANGAC
ncbi:MAG: hypothetical protein CTY15_01275 [Methylocystis sp.]|nr:MAG: hypothetical protein CTY15_01275 [Methylocystis sp.]